MKVVEDCKNCWGKGTVVGAYDFVGSCGKCEGTGHIVYDTEDRFSEELDKFLSEVKSEVIRARTKFPGRRIMGLALAEEFGELMKAMLDEHLANVRKEAVQTAAMCIRVAVEGDESIDEWRSKRGLGKLGF